MSSKRKLKRRIRERMAITGESYMAARRHIVTPDDEDRQSFSLADWALDLPITERDRKESE